MVKSLVESLRKAVPMLIRSAPSTDDYLEGVLSRQDLQGCYALLCDALGPPIKEFGKAAKFGSDTQRIVERIGGIRIDQCLFLKQEAGGQTIYASLWPWASDPTRITLKTGVVELK